MQSVKKVETEKKKERSAKETEDLKRSFLLNFNSYNVGSIKDLKFDKLHNHVFQGDGDYIVVNNRIGNFYSKMNEADRPGLVKELGKSIIHLKVPKIPSHFYYEIISLFREVSREMGNGEAFIQLYYDTKDKKYIAHVPEQIVSPASVRYDATKNLNEVEKDRYIFVFEVHSHNTMNAFWSGTDNADEKDTRFYGVFGKINENKIEEKFRYMVMGKEFSVTRHDIFDFSEEVTVNKESLISFFQKFTTERISKADIYKALESKKEYKHPKEWMKNIQKHEIQRQNTFINRKNIDGDSFFNGMEQNHYNNNWYSNEDCKVKKKFQRSEYLGMTSYNNDDPTNYLERDILEDYIDIEDTFNLDNYEAETKQPIIETIISSLDLNDVTLLLETLVDHGHDGVIQSFNRK